MIPVAILCGGKGTRLAPLTDHLPKSLVDVNGKPFILHQLDLLKRQGYTDVVLLTGHLGSMIEAVVGDGSALGMSIGYSHDGDEPLGPDRAITKALPMLGDAFLVLYGDSYLVCDYGLLEHHLQSWPAFDAAFATYRGINYGLRLFRRYPASTWIDIEMQHAWEEIGSFEGLERVRAITR